MNTQRLAYYLSAVTDKRIEEGVDDYFKFYYKHLLNRHDLSILDFKRILHCCCLKDQQTKHCVTDKMYSQLLSKFKDMVQQDAEDETDFEVLDILNSWGELPLFP